MIKLAINSGVSLFQFIEVVCSWVKSFWSGFLRFGLDEGVLS